MRQSKRPQSEAGTQDPGWEAEVPFPLLPPKVVTKVPDRTQDKEVKALTQSLDNKRNLWSLGRHQLCCEFWFPKSLRHLGRSWGLKRSFQELRKGS